VFAVAFRQAGAFLVWIVIRMPTLSFFHQTYPAQFGPIMQHLLHTTGADITYYCQFVNKQPDPRIRVVQHPLHLPNRKEEEEYFYTRYFEREARSMAAALQAFERVQEKTPDVLVGHVAWGNLMFFHVAYPEIPTVGFFELYYGLQDEARNDLGVQRPNRLRVPLRNATQLLELEYCHRGYSPTEYQRLTYPAAYRNKLATLFDGIDTTLYAPGPVSDASTLVRTWPQEAKLVTFVSRGLEAYRGFDKFVAMAHQLCQHRTDVHFVIAGRPQTHYGSEMTQIKEDSFKSYVLKQFPDLDASRFHFVGWLPEPALADLFRLSDCHFYWTVPFTLSWSLFQAMASGCAVVGSDTAPVRELVWHGETGLLVPPEDIDAMVAQVLDVLALPQTMQSYRQNARQLAVERYSFDSCLPKLASFYLEHAPHEPTPAMARSLTASQSAHP
jgi:glycosyltransferase involved in cell wall biosynthesis